MVRAEPTKNVFVIKSEEVDRYVETMSFVAQKTMYGGKHIAAGDTIFIFESENEGGEGLIALGTVTSASAVPKKPGVARQAPRVSIVVRLGPSARKPLGRDQLKSYTSWSDGKPETELSFKLYRQATNKIIGITPATGEFLQSLL